MKASTALAIAISAIFVSLTTFSAAQAMMMARPSVDPSLLTNPVVQKDLALNDDQKTKMGELMRKVSENHIEISGGGEEEMREQLREYQEKFDKQMMDGLKAILDEKQMTRFGQINRQSQGIRGFTDKEAKPKLALTPDQTKKIEALTEAFDNEHGELIHSIMQTDGNSQELRIGPAETKKLQAMAAKYYDKGLAILTEEQKVKWQELVGTKLDLIIN